MGVILKTTYITRTGLHIIPLEWDDMMEAYWCLTKEYIGDDSEGNPVIYPSHDFYSAEFILKGVLQDDK